MIKKIYTFAFFASLFVISLMAYQNKDNDAPHVIKTFPENGSENLDTSIHEISVTFSEPMMDKGWSWSYDDKSKFPDVAGTPYYKDNFTTCILPVKLKPAHEYVIWVNTKDFKNFKDISGNPADPFKFSFKTK